LSEAVAPRASHPLPIARMLGLLGARRITLQARYRRLRDIERPRYIRLRVAVSEALESFQGGPVIVPTR